MCCCCTQILFPAVGSVQQQEQQRGGHGGSWHGDYCSLNVCFIQGNSAGVFTLGVLFYYPRAASKVPGKKEQGNWVQL